MRGIGARARVSSRIPLPGRRVSANRSETGVAGASGAPLEHGPRFVYPTIGWDAAACGMPDASRRTRAINVSVCAGNMRCNVVERWSVAMSIVVVVQKDGTLVAAADSLGTNGAHIQPEDLVVGKDKVRRIGDSLFGFVGYSVYRNVFDCVFANEELNPTFHDRSAVFEFFVKFARLLASDYHFVAETEDDGSDEDGGSPFVKLNSNFIVANTNGIFVVDSDIAVIQYQRFWAIGSAYPIALGALHAVYNQDLSAREIATIGVEAAIKFHNFCGGGITVTEL